VRDPKVRLRGLGEISRLMFQVTGAFAEFERSMIRQRVHAGLKRAVEAGKALGRPFKAAR
jgi:DNA invertase Pin-like site-specific DNA recombinase